MKPLLCLMLAVAFLGIDFPCSAAEFEARTGFRYQGWSSDDDETGYQVYLPVYLRGAVDRLIWEVVAGYASTGGDLANSDGDRSISGFLDTQLNLGYELPQIAGVDSLLGLDINLPTGKTNEDPRDLRIMLDPDLVSIVSPGQGLNFNPSVNLARRWSAWTFGFGAGYAFQGEYDYSTEQQDYDPGDILNLAAEILYDWGSGWQTRLYGQYATFGTDTLAGEDLLKRGDTLLVGAGLLFKLKAYAAALTVQTIRRDKSEYRDSSVPGGIATESRNGHGDEYLADLAGQYHLTEATHISAGIAYLHVEENDYDPGDDFYVGKRTKASLRLGLGHKLSDTVDIQGGVDGFIMEAGSNFLHPGEDRTYRGWTVSLAASTRF